MRPLTTNERKLLLWGGGAIAAMLLISRKVDTIQPRRDAEEPTNDDLDMLTQVVLMETDFAHSKDEMAQIVWVALNRMASHNASAREVVLAGNWCHVPECIARFNNMRSHPRFEDAKKFVQSVQSDYQNRKYYAFIHPAGMPGTTTFGGCSRSDLVPADTIAGRRCIPKWSVGTPVIGKAMFADARHVQGRV